MKNGQQLKVEQQQPTPPTNDNRAAPAHVQPGRPQLRVGLLCGVKLKMKLLILLVMGLSIQANACICLFKPIKEYIKLHPDAVFIKGKVIDTNVGKNVFNRFGPGTIVNVAVEEYWPKGALYDVNVVSVFNEGKGCAVDFQKDSVYFIRGYNVNRYVVTTLCDGTKLASKATDDLVFLGAGFRPEIPYNYADEPNEVHPNSTVDKPVPPGMNPLHGYLLGSVLLNIVLLIFVLTGRKNFTQ